jgi:NADPH-dependent ferric siderophore reductase
MAEISELAVTRVRHPLKVRLLRVDQVDAVTPSLVRVTFTGEDLADFESASFDDHIKLFFPAPGADCPHMPSLGPQGLIFDPAQPRPVVRDFTPRRFDRATRELVIEFALHEAGPATAWARQARAGQYLGVAGPRGSRVIPAGFDWHLLIGDDTALPAIARRLQELPATVQAIAVIEVADGAARIDLSSAASLHVVWCLREPAGAGDTLLQAVRTVPLPAGEGYVWAAGESGSIRAVRQHLLSERGIDKSRLHASGYWKRGTADVHDHFDE